MNEDFVPFELAKKLKEKGFDYTCVGHYVNNQLYIAHYHNAFHSDKDESVDAPTISQVLKWLREEKNIHIEIRLFNNGYGFDIYKIYPKERMVWSGTLEYETFEQAALKGVEYVLDSILKQ